MTTRLSAEMRMGLELATFLNCWRRGFLGIMLRLWLKRGTLRLKPAKVT